MRLDTDRVQRKIGGGIGSVRSPNQLVCGACSTEFATFSSLFPVLHPHTLSHFCYFFRHLQAADHVRSFSLLFSRPSPCCLTDNLLLTFQRPHGLRGACGSMEHSQVPFCGVAILYQYYIRSMMVYILGRDTSSRLQYCCTSCWISER